MHPPRAWSSRLSVTLLSTAHFTPSSTIAWRFDLQFRRQPTVHMFSLRLIRGLCSENHGTFWANSCLLSINFISFRHLSFPNIFGHRAWDIRFQLTGPLIVQTQASPSIITTGVGVSILFNFSVHLALNLLFFYSHRAAQPHRYFHVTRALFDFDPRGFVSSRLYGTDLIYELNETFFIHFLLFLSFSFKS